MNVLITGASKGIGAALVGSALEKGHTVFGATRNKAGLDESVLLNTAFTPLVIDWPLHAGELRERLLFIGQVKIDILINNAGLLIKDELSKLKANDMREMFDVNTIYPLWLTRHLIEMKKLSPNASVINIGSMGGVQGAAKFRGLGGYSVSKGALAVLTECMAAEWGDELNVNCLCLGAVQTDMLKQAFPDYIAPISDVQMAEFILDFACSSRGIVNGSVIPVKISNP